jgi:chromosome partitioning protein
LLNATDATTVLVPTEIVEIDLIPAGKQLHLAERYLPSRPRYQHILKNALHPLESTYDYILLDCPPSLGVLNTNALVAANMALLPTQAEYFSAYALKPTLQTLQTIRQRHNPGLTYRILLTMFRRRNRAHRIIRSRLEATFGGGLCNTVIETDTKLREAAIVGVPITHFSPRSRSAQQYRDLAQELVAYVQKESVRETA